MNRDNTLFLLLALLLLGGGGYAVYNMTRGLRNNNPGNIEDDGVTPWEGLATPRNDGEAPVPMLRFINAAYGIRALKHVLTSYVTLDGVPATLRGILSRFAPPSENDTEAYISDGEQALGIDDTTLFDLPSALPALVALITRHENGLNPYSDAEIAAGLALA